MPTYEFNSSHLNMLVKYFNTLDKQEYPFELSEDTNNTPDEYQAAEKLFSEEYFGCTKCHVVGDKLPTGTKDTWAPNLALAKTRLKPGWLSRWIKNPQDVIPGTKMPTFYDPASYSESGPPDILNGDEDNQIRVLRNYLLHMTETKASPAPKPAPKPAPVAEAPADVPAAQPAVAK
jgi:cytochrome c2